jgi:hypothetical protein
MRPETKSAYPSDWKQISWQTKKDRNWACEGCGQKGSKPRNPLTVHHVDYDPKNNKPVNLLVLCAKCHLRLQQGTTPSLLREREGQLTFFTHNIDCANMVPNPQGVKKEEANDNRKKG